MRTFRAGWRERLTRPSSGLWRWLVAGGLALAIGILPLASGYRLACQGELNAFSALSGAEQRLNDPHPAASAPHTQLILPLDAHFEGAIDSAGARALQTVLEVKQADVVAFPAHMLLASALQAGGCDRAAVRVQWIKAALHASRPENAERAAQALASLTTPGEQAAVATEIGRAAAENPWSDGIRSVQLAYQRSTSS